MPQIERIPPHSDDAERSVLGSILIDRDVFFKVSEFIDADDFYSKAHREIFSAMKELFSEDSPIDFVTVTDILNKRKSLDACGGRSYITELSGEVITTSNAVQYARIIQEKAVYRKLITACSGVVENCFNESADAEKTVDRAESEIFEIAKNRQTRDYTTIQNVLSRNLEEMKEAEKHPGELPGLSTGFRDLDNMTLGLQRSDLIILAARPSMGKTAFAMNLAQHAALKLGKRVAFFSVEMADIPVGYRFLSMEARVDGKKIRRNQLSAEDWDNINEAVERFGKADLLIDATPGISVMEVRNKCRRMTAEKKLDLVIIDYLQIMSSDGRSDNRVNEVAMMSRYLKQMARELDCPVIVLSQLSRSTVQRKDGDNRPMLQDLRDSGAIEQDADVVMFLHRDDYYKKKEAPFDNKCELIIAKQRQGETGSINLTWMPKYQRFSDYISDDRM